MSQGETVLNWQSEYALAQNKVLKRIESKVDSIQNNFHNVIESFSSRASSLESIIEELRGRIDKLHHVLKYSAMNR